MLSEENDDFVRGCVSDRESIPAVEVEGLEIANEELFAIDELEDALATAFVLEGLLTLTDGLVDVTSDEPKVVGEGDKYVEKNVDDADEDEEDAVDFNDVDVPSVEAPVPLTSKSEYTDPPC